MRRFNNNEMKQLNKNDQLFVDSSWSEVVKVEHFCHGDNTEQVARQFGGIFLPVMVRNNTKGSEFLSTKPAFGTKYSV